MTAAGADWADLYQHAPCGLISTGPGGRIATVNDTFLDWTGHRREDLAGARFTTVVTTGDRIYFQTHVVPLLRMQGSVREIAITLVCPGGRRLSALLNASMAEGAPDGVARIAVFPAGDRRAYERELLAARRRAEDSDARASQLARTLQASLLPPALPEIAGLELAAVYRPAGRGDEVGGDFYDAFESAPGDWTVILGDVCGKGAAAAAITSLVRHTTRAIAARARDPRTILTALNRVVLGEQSRTQALCFSTLACVRIVTAPPSRPGAAPRISVGLAGHPFPYLVRDGSAPAPVGRRGTLLGVAAAPWLRAVPVALDPGDALVLYTDGVTEARNGHDFWGEKRLEDLLTTLRGQDAATIAQGITDAVLGFQHGNASDDIAIVVLRRP
ncbi:MAG: phosphoserine phosphatase RsbU/P [Cryptosporangiaceae bacterium]|nr:phosphoserine phosphatase RsbU/P [Cryptosporangiaceae bacterium]